MCLMRANSAPYGGSGDVNSRTRSYVESFVCKKFF